MSLDAIQQQGLKAAGDVLIKAFQEELLRQDHSATGELIDSFKQNINLTIQGGELIITMNRYGGAVEKGRAAGRKGVPIFALMDWIVTKGIERDINKVKGVAFAIQKTIIREGSPTRGSLSMRSPKTDFINIGLANVRNDVFKIINDVMTRSMSTTFENMIKEQQESFNNL